MNTIDVVNVAQVNCMSNFNVFRKLLEDVEKPLYCGCMKCTKLLNILYGMPKIKNMMVNYVTHQTPLCGI